MIISSRTRRWRSGVGGLLLIVGLVAAVLIPRSAGANSGAAQAWNSIPSPEGQPSVLAPSTAERLNGAATPVSEGGGTAYETPMSQAIQATPSVRAAANGVNIDVLNGSCFKPSATMLSSFESKRLVVPCVV
jgi:hypothetical protein